MLVQQCVHFDVLQWNISLWCRGAEFLKFPFEVEQLIICFINSESLWRPVWREHQRNWTTTLASNGSRFYSTTKENICVQKIFVMKWKIFHTCSGCCSVSWTQWRRTCCHQLCPSGPRTGTGAQSLVYNNKLSIIFLVGSKRWCLPWHRVVGRVVGVVGVGHLTSRPGVLQIYTSLGLWLDLGLYQIQSN